MACVKSVNQSVSVAVAPDVPYMVVGMMAGPVDMSFSTSTVLEIFKLNFQFDDHDLPVIGEYQSSKHFNCLAWGCNGSGSESYELGLVDGRIDVCNTLSLIG